MFSSVCRIGRGTSRRQNVRSRYVIDYSHVDCNCHERLFGWHVVIAPKISYARRGSICRRKHVLDVPGLMTEETAKRTENSRHRRKSSLRLTVDREWFGLSNGTIHLLSLWRVKTAHPLPFLSPLSWSSGNSWSLLLATSRGHALLHPLRSFNRSLVGSRFSLSSRNRRNHSVWASFILFYRCDK